MTKSLYLIGSLRNPKLPTIAARLRGGTDFEVFDDWYAAGPEADDYWRKYEKDRGRSYAEALQGRAAQHVFSFDWYHLSRAHTVVLALPAGRSGHLELGWAIGKGKWGYILLEEEEPERWDLMYNFAHGVFGNVEDLLDEVNRNKEWRG